MPPQRRRRSKRLRVGYYDIVGRVKAASGNRRSITSQEIATTESLVKQMNKEPKTPTNYEEFREYVSWMTTIQECSRMEMGVHRVLQAIRESRHLFKGEKSKTVDDDE